MTTLEILNDIGIPRCRSGYLLTDDDLAYLADKYNKNLIIIKNYQEKNSTPVNNTAIVYYKPNRTFIGIFHTDNHWTPGRINTNNQLVTIRNTIIFLQ